MARRARWVDIYERLRRRILTLDLEPGTQLSESGLALEYGVSPTPVRDALGRLSQENLVTTRPGRGYWVAPLEIRDLHQLAEFRFILERGVCEILMQAKRDWTQVRATSAELRKPGLVPDEIVDANIEFHLSLAQLTGNDQLAHALKRVLEDSARFFRLGTPFISPGSMADDHDRLLDALERSDMEAASKICHSEAYGTRDRVINVLLDSSSDLPGVSLGFPRVKAITLQSESALRTVVIGGGIIGACSAYFLSLKGHSVTVVEASSIGDGATGLSAGAFRSQFASSVETQLTMRSRELWKDFERDHRIDLGYRRVGFVVVASDEQTERELARRDGFQRDLGLDIRDLSMMELAEVFPNMQTDDILRATYTPEDGYATPADTTKQIMEVARTRGVRVLQHTEVVEILARDDRIEAVVTSADGPIPCDVVVNAAGLFAGQIGALVGLDIPVGAYRQHQYFTEEITGFASESIPNFIDPALGLYLRGEGHGMLLSVARDDDARRLDFVVDESLLNDLAQKMLHRWPYLADIGIANSWVGCYPITPDSRAIVGDVPEIQGFYNAAGLGGHGFMHGFATGEAICNLICDGKWGTIDLSEFALDRFLDDRRKEGASPLTI